MDALAHLNRLLVGRYQLDREIGRGGMATVYLARDEKHHRRVALKVLNPELGAVLGVVRFLAEIEVTANLQHPNLLPLFDSGETDGLLYYVMPFIEGESLRAKLDREKQLPIDEALHLAMSIAAAVDYAHRCGVIHRDLKPENILLHEGQPLVADFGIALAINKAGGERMTQSGLSLGTPQYMSPEQAAGDRAIDGRTDIYSLGAMLYEMLTGDPPHVGSTSQAVIARVITDTPRPVSASRPHVSPAVDAAVARALEKLPADRFTTAQAFATALASHEGVTTAPAVRWGDKASASATTSRWPRPVALAFALVAGMAIAALAVVAARRAPFQAYDRQSVTFAIEPPARDSAQPYIETFSVSHDGKSVAFVADIDSTSKLYVRRLSELDARHVAGTDGASYAVFSPDGTSLAVGMRDGRVLKVSIDGRAAPITLAKRIHPYFQAFWSPDGIVLGRVEPGVGLQRIASTGGTPRRLFKPKSPSWEHGLPVVSTDGATVLFLDSGPGFTEDDFLAIGSAESGQYERTSLLANQPLGIVDDRIIYLSAGAILAVPFDRRRLRITGEPARVVEGVSRSDTRSAVLSPTGTLAFRKGELTVRLAIRDPAGHFVPLTGELQLSFDQSPPRFSPDGRRIVMVRGAMHGDTLSSDVWIFDIAAKSLTRLTSVGDASAAEWTPDGQSIVFVRGNAGPSKQPGVWRQSANGERPPEAVLEAREGESLTGGSVTPDGRGVLICRPTFDPSSTAELQLSYLPLNGGGPEQPVLRESMEPRCDARVSPDGKWLAYSAPEDSAPRIYVRPFRRPGARVAVSVGAGSWPNWSPDGSRLYYSQSGGFLASAVLVVLVLDRTADHVTVRDRTRAALLPSSTYDIARDGRILGLQVNASGMKIVVTTNWLSELRARLAGVR
jgi:eukaryotic-like serine/threonine-protein kinase